MSEKVSVVNPKRIDLRNWRDWIDQPKAAQTIVDFRIALASHPTTREIVPSNKSTTLKPLASKNNT